LIFDEVMNQTKLSFILPHPTDDIARLCMMVYITDTWHIMNKLCSKLANNVCYPM